MGFFSKDITCLLLLVKGGGGSILVDGADEKKEMGTALCGLSLLFLIFLKSWRDVNVTYIWSGPILFDLSAF